MSHDSVAVRAMREKAVPTLHTIDAVARSLGLAADLAIPPRGLGTGPDGPSADLALAAPADYLTGRDRLEAYGVRYPRARAIETREDVDAAVGALTAPFVLKAGWIEHRTDVGGVVVGLEGAAEVRHAFEDMRARLGDGVVVLEEMDRRPDVVELIVGARRDPSFGPIVMVGMGGVLAEVYRDVRIGLAPVSEGQARAMLSSLQAFAVLEGWRGRPALDVGSAARVVSAVSRVLAEQSDIAECEINPLRVGVDGAVAVDALVIRRPTAAPGTDRSQPHDRPVPREFTGTGRPRHRGWLRHRARHRAALRRRGRRPSSCSAGDLEPSRRRCASRETYGVSAAAIACDVRDPDAVTAAVDSVVADHGRIDALVNNAAGNFVCPAEDLSPNGWRAVVDIVLNGTFYATRAAAQHMLRRGPGRHPQRHRHLRVARPPGHRAQRRGQGRRRRDDPDAGRPSGAAAGCASTASLPAPPRPEGPAPHSGRPTRTATPRAGRACPPAASPPRRRWPSPPPSCSTDRRAGYVNGDVLTVDGGQWLGKSVYADSSGAALSPGRHDRWSGTGGRTRGARRRHGVRHPRARTTWRSTGTCPHTAYATWAPGTSREPGTRRTATHAPPAGWASSW